MWHVFEHRSLDRRLSGAPREVLVRCEKCKDVVALSGPAGLRRISGFNDEALSGEWLGHRYSRLGIQWRDIYRVEAEEGLEVSVTPHDYRRA